MSVTHNTGTVVFRVRQVLKVTSHPFQVLNRRFPRGSV